MKLKNVFSVKIPYTGKNNVEISSTSVSVMILNLYNRVDGLTIK